MEIKEKPYFIPMLRLLEMIPFSVWEESNRMKAYMEKLIKCLTDEGYHVDAKLINERLRYFNGEKVNFATMDNKEYY